MNIAIEVDKISLSFGSRKILDEISFSVKAGTIHGFLGPNGAGKTSTMKIITNLLEQNAGVIKVFGSDLSKNNKYINTNLGHLLEDAPLYDDLTVREYLIYVLKLRKVSKVNIEEYLHYALNVLDLTDVADRLIGNLSKGYKQRVGIAQTIIHKPKIIILDEPTNGLDPQSMMEVRNLILKLKENHTVLLSSHLLHEMSLVCDEVTIISGGKVLASGKIEELREKINNELVIQLYLTQKVEAFERFLAESENINDFKSDNEGHYLIRPSTTREIRPEIVKSAVELGAEVLKISVEKSTLEDIFISITEHHD